MSLETFPVRGQVTLRDANSESCFLVPNQIQYACGFVMAKLLGHGDMAYRGRILYVEFENVDDPEDAVSIPTFTRSEGLEYYDNLVSVPTRDVLRVPLSLQPSISVSPGFSGELLPTQGNRLTVFAQTAGQLAGIHGREFSAASNSKICGCALAAAPVIGDRSQDIIIARTYYPAESQLLKTASSQISITWDLDLFF